jgi:ketosteroid isomerase-like protein
MNQSFASGSLRATATAVTISLGLALAAPARGEDKSEEFAKAVDQTWTEYAALLNAGDADAWIKLWDDMGVQLPPGAPAIVGKAAILRASRGKHETYDYEKMLINNEEVEVSGDLGFARGTYSLLLIPRGRRGQHPPRRQVPDNIQTATGRDLADLSGCVQL